ncbi:hypothetical protein [Synechococcus phage S-B64]|uniref:YadA domain-containing structural protein n=2 Tax=Shandvirus TaxID=2948904 RepID=A0A1Z1LW96_9CAUD|nr:virion structural protein [Synechococcus phage S-H35]YP_010095385.1 virion structural protein [Synechococcus phage S-B64]ARW56926.1 hypothetical protein [Synechococcus phage S-H35]AWD90183.1 hypothetical protein [Synechococcus phage S-B64]
MGTRKISQLDTISDANLSGEAILPVVVSDPLIPNRKAKVNQLFKGVTQGTKDAPGLCFDLDRDTGLYQNAYDQFGISFGDGGFYMTRIVNAAESTSLYITAIDDTADNANIVLAPKGTGTVQVTGQFLISDGSFVLQDALGPKARFEVSNVGTGTGTRIMTLPAITAGNGTILVGDDTQQTLRNKTILIDEDNFVLFDNQDEAIFQLNYADSSGQRRSFFLPDAGAVTTTSEPTATSSTLIDTKTEQTLISKTLVNLKLASADAASESAQFNTDALTADRIITVPDLNLTLVGTDTTQILTNKVVESLIFQDSTDNTKKFTLEVDNQLTLTNSVVKFPPGADLNITGSDANIIVTEQATETLSNKTLVQPVLKDTRTATNDITIRLDNITGNRTIRFPDADATLLSTENVTLDDVNFGAGIGAANLTGRTRQQQFFYAGF